MKELNASVDTEVREAIAAALAAIDAMPRPFVNNRTDERNGIAAQACATLSEKLEKAGEVIREN